MLVELILFDVIVFDVKLVIVTQPAVRFVVVTFAIIRFDPVIAPDVILLTLTAFPEMRFVTVILPKLPLDVTMLLKLPVMKLLRLPFELVKLPKQPLALMKVKLVVLMHPLITPFVLTVFDVTSDIVPLVLTIFDAFTFVVLTFVAERPPERVKPDGPVVILATVRTLVILIEPTLIEQLWRFVVIMLPVKLKLPDAVVFCREVKPETVRLPVLVFEMLAFEMVALAHGALELPI